MGTARCPFSLQAAIPQGPAHSSVRFQATATRSVSCLAFAQEGQHARQHAVAQHIVVV
jgi:hypothetical protein